MIRPTICCAFGQFSNGHVGAPVHAAGTSRKRPWIHQLPPRAVGCEGGIWTSFVTDLGNSEHNVVVRYLTHPNFYIKSLGKPGS